jgi:ribosome maturation factor RimP
MEITARIERLLEGKYAEDEAYADCFTVDLEIKPVNRLHVYVDSDSGMTFEKCKGISRFLEGHLDAHQWLGERYVLEVSSPGLSRPLKFPRQYLRNLGRTLVVELANQTKAVGTLVRADDQHIVISATTIEREGNKKKEVTTETLVRYEDIIKALVKPSF